MKKLYVFLLITICCISGLQAQTLYWVGGNSNYGNAANWSFTSGGSGGAGVPGASNDVVFDDNATITIDVTPVTVNGILITDNSTVELNTSSNTLITVNSANAAAPALKVDAGSILRTVTASDVTFDFTFASTGARGLVNGNWIFEGSVVLNNGEGANVNAEGSALVEVNGQVIFRDNSGFINASPATFSFEPNAQYRVERNAGLIPDVSYDPLSSIFITGSTTSLPVFPGSTLRDYGSIIYDLPGLLEDQDMRIQVGSVIHGDLRFLNTNGKSITIVPNTGGSPITVTVMNELYVTGNSRVWLANENNNGDPSPGNSYFLQVGTFNQDGGQFSIQQDNGVTASSTLGVSGNVVQSGGTFGINSTASSTSNDLFILELNGSTNQGVSLLDNNQAKLTLKMNSATGGSASLASAFFVKNLDLTSGVLNTTTTANPGSVLTVSSADAVNGVRNGSDISYVNGALRRAVNSTLEYIFPTGKSGSYHAVSVVPAGTPSGSVFEAEYFNTQHPDPSVLPPLAAISDVEYWIVNRPSGSDQAAVRIRLNRRDPRATSSHSIVVAKYDGSDWVSVGNTGTTVFGDASTGTVTSVAQSTFSPFTLAIEGNAALPIHLLSFDAKKLNNGARLDWKTEDPALRFEVYRSSNGRDYTHIGTVNAAPTVTDYHFFDPVLQPGTNYYRLKSVERDGNISYSKVAVLINKQSGVEITSMAPNLVRDKSKLSITAVRGGHMDVVITDLTGRTWRRLGITVSPGNSETTVNLSELPAGAYQLTGYMNGERTQVIRFVKQ